MSFLKTKKCDKVNQWLASLDFACLDIHDVLGDLTDDYIHSLLKLLQSKDRDNPLEISAAKIISRIAYPKEIVPGIRKRIFATSGVIPKLLYFGQQGYIRPYLNIKRSELQFGEEIAKGSGGTVFAGKWQNKNVAIKVCGKLGMFFTSEEDFRFETTVMSLLDHPNIMKCYGANSKDKEPFIIMPLLEFGTLTNVLRNPEKKLSSCKRLHIAIQLAEAVKYMHRCGLIHRDLKPSNVLVGSDFSVSLIDFGISRIWEGKRPMTMNIGTPAWIAPEILDGNGIYSYPVDVYSFGIILWEIMTGEMPFQSLGIQSFDVPLQVVKGLRPDIPSSVPQDISSLIQLCWHANPKKRPTFEKIQQRLLEIQSDIMWFRRPDTVSTPAPPVPVIVIEEPTNTSPTKRHPTDWTQFKSYRNDSRATKPFLLGRRTTASSRGSPSVNIGQRTSEFNKSAQSFTGPGSDPKKPTNAFSLPKSSNFLGVKRSNSFQSSVEPSTFDSDSELSDIELVTTPEREIASELQLEEEVEVEVNENENESAHSSSFETKEEVEFIPPMSPNHPDNLKEDVSRGIALPNEYTNLDTNPLGIEISSIAFIETNIFWVGTTLGKILILEDSSHGQSQDWVLVDDILAYEPPGAVTSITTISHENQVYVWTTSLTGATSCWRASDREKLWEHEDKYVAGCALVVRVNDISRVWISISNKEECAIRVWNPAFPKRVSKIEIVPPEGVEGLVVQSIAQYKNYVAIGAGTFIYIYDGHTFEALSYWQAHEDPIRGLCVLKDNLWSFCQDAYEIKLWHLDVQEETKVVGLKQLPLYNLYSFSTLCFIQRVENSMWCYYRDGTLVVFDNHLQKQFSSTWLESGVDITQGIYVNQKLIIAGGEILYTLSRET